MTTLHNQVTLIGQIASEKRITEFEGGNKVVHFYLNAEESSNRQRHKVFAWGTIAKFLETFGDKGKRVMIHGRLVPRNYFNLKGEKRTINEIEIRNIVEL